MKQLLCILLLAFLTTDVFAAGIDTALTAAWSCRDTRAGITNPTETATCAQVTGFAMGYIAGAHYYANGQCIPPIVPAEQLQDAFIHYVDEHPEVKKLPYDSVLRDAIESRYCPRFTGP